MIETIKFNGITLSDMVCLCCDRSACIYQEILHEIINGREQQVIHDVTEMDNIYSLERLTEWANNTNIINYLREYICILRYIGNKLVVYFTSRIYCDYHKNMHRIQFNDCKESLELLDAAAEMLNVKLINDRISKKVNISLKTIKEIKNLSHAKAFIKKYFR